MMLKLYLLIASAFEFIALYRVHVALEPLAIVAPIHRTGSQQVIVYYSFLAAGSDYRSYYYLPLSQMCLFISSALHSPAPIIILVSASTL